MFNSPVPLAVTAALIGAIANTLRLELVDLINFPPAAAAFIGALTAGLLASLIKIKLGIQESLSLFLQSLLWFRDFIFTEDSTTLVLCPLLLPRPGLLLQF